MSEISYCIKDGVIEPIRPISQDYMLQVYEVIRFINSVSVFFEQHFERFLASCKTAGVQVPVASQELAQLSQELAQKNNIVDCNLKYYINMYSNGSEFYANFIKSSYPTPAMYSNGVDVGILHEERANPNAKIQNKSMRMRADELIAENHFFEVALIDRNGLITEGSKSNLFFIGRDGCIYTAPLSMVLGGITREVIIEEINKLGFELIEKAVAIDDIQNVEAAFISGTSPSVLPIKQFNSVPLSAENPMVEAISRAYNKRVSDDICQFRSKF